MATTFGKIMIAPLVVAGLASCATVVRGTTDTLSITTVPEGAQVVSDIPSTASSTAFVGCDATPCSVEVPRRAAGLLTISLDGYESISYRVVSSATTSNDVLVPGAVIAGVPPGSHVVVSTPQAGSQVGLRGASGLTGIATSGAGSVIDAMSGATRNIAPQAVTVYLAPTAPAGSGG